MNYSIGYSDLALTISTRSQIYTDKKVRSKKNIAVKNSTDRRDVKHRSQKQRQGCKTMQRFVSQPHNKHRTFLESEKGLYNNDGVIMHTLQQSAKWSKADYTKVKITMQSSSSHAVRFHSIVLNSPWVEKAWTAIQQRRRKHT